ncbi:MAG: helix-turn-helix domain-containing protein [Hungatella sp.]
MNVKEAAAKRIEILCKERGIAYNELANLCDVTPSTIYSVLDPKRKNVTLSTIKKYATDLKSHYQNFSPPPSSTNWGRKYSKFHSIQKSGGYHKPDRLLIMLTHSLFTKNTVQP